MFVFGCVYVSSQLQISLAWPPKSLEMFQEPHQILNPRKTFEPVWDAWFTPAMESSKGGGSFLNSVAEKKGHRVQDLLAIAICKVAKLSLKKNVCNFFFFIVKI